MIHKELLSIFKFFYNKHVLLVLLQKGTNKKKRTVINPQLIMFSHLDLTSKKHRLKFKACHQQYIRSIRTQIHSLITFNHSMLTCKLSQIVEEFIGKNSSMLVTNLMLRLVRPVVHNYQAPLVLFSGKQKKTYFALSLLLTPIHLMALNLILQHPKLSMSVLIIHIRVIFHSPFYCFKGQSSILSFYPVVPTGINVYKN